MASIDAFARYCEKTCNKDLGRCKDLTAASSIEILKKQRATSRKRVIALGFSHCLTRADVNRILVGCGYPKLYARNLIELTIGYELDRHSQLLNESIQDALEHWLSIYQRAREICGERDVNALSDLSKGIKLQDLKAFIVSQSPEKCVYTSVTSEGNRFTTHIVRKAAAAKTDEEFLQIIADEAAKFRRYRANARLMFIRYLVFCVEATMKCYWSRQDSRPTLEEMFREAVIDYTCWESVQESIQGVPIRLYTIAERLYEYYAPVGDNMFFGAEQDDSEGDEIGIGGDPVENLEDYFRGVVKGIKDITRPVLLFFILFANQKILDAFEYDQSVSLDENRLNELLKRCYGGGLSPTSRIDRLACTILHLQIERKGSSRDNLLYKTDETLYVRELSDYELREEDMIIDRPLGASFNSTFSDTLENAIVKERQ